MSKRLSARMSLALASIVSVAAACSAEDRPYTPSPANIEARERFQDAAFGVFIHWGVYSVLGDGEWVMHKKKMTVDEYRPLAARFNPTGYDPAEWVALFKRAGAKYITITSKHHDGFAMWDSKQTDWDIVDATPYGKDVLKMLAVECERQGMDLFFYHSHLDWTHPDYFPRGRTGRHSGRAESGEFPRYLDFMDAQLAELLNGDYGRVSGIWFDGWWDQKKRNRGKKELAEVDPKATFIDWRLDQTYGLIHRLQPACLIGNNHHVAPFPGEDFQMYERDLPGQNTTGFSADAEIGELPLESCDTINKSWGYKKDDKAIKSKRELVHYLVRAAGQGANLLLNVGPRPDGTIQPGFAKRLTQMGDWLGVNGETIYGTRSGPVTPQAWGVSTRRGDQAYLHVLKAPAAGDDGWVTLSGTAALGGAPIRAFPSGEPVPARRDGAGVLELKLPEAGGDGIDTILSVKLGE
ncbi:MAG: alpha-L-fucosidase [Planctomycetota bacterium]